MTPEQMIEVIKAEQAGKKLEVRARRSGTAGAWYERPSTVAFNFQEYAYRVKVEPVLTYGIRKANGELFAYTYMQKATAELVLQNHGGKLVEFREVMENG